MNNEKTKRSITRTALIGIIILVFLLSFVSCGDMTASSTGNEDTPKSPGTWAPPPEYDPIELPTYEIPEAGLKEPTTQPNQGGTASTARYAASRESNKYHRPSCYYVDNILPENLFYFSSTSAARQAGYSPCSVCEP